MYFRCEPRRLRWIGGFGEIRWIEKANYSAFNRDPVTYAGIDIIQHMNDDHPEALVDLLRHYVGKSATREAIGMVGISSSRFVVSFGKGNEQERAEIQFIRTAKNPEEVRSILIEMLKIARQK